MADLATGAADLLADLVIRFADTTDAEAIEHVEERADVPLFEALGAPEPLEAEDGSVRLEMPGFLLVAEKSGDLIGFAHVIEYDGECHLEQLSVDPDFARRGLGRALLQAAQGQAASRGHSEMTLRTFANIAWNAPFYATCGFEITVPATPFQFSLAETEFHLGLDDLGPRVQMTCPLAPSSTGR